MKQEVNIYTEAARINDSMKHGILLTTKAADRVNTMTIGWGAMGTEWGRPIFTAFVRESRYTRELLDASGEFTVSIPTVDSVNRILAFCGKNSGRDVDKIKELGLTPEDPVMISVPGFRELPLTLECRVLYRQVQELAGMPQNILDRYYPAFHADGSPDRHIAYYGEILCAYRIES